MYGFLNLIKTAWAVGMVFYWYGMANTVTNIGYDIFSSYISFSLITQILSLILMIVIMVYLFSKKEYFTKTTVIEERYLKTGAVKRPTGITVLAFYLMFGLIINLFLFFSYYSDNPDVTISILYVVPIPAQIYYILLTAIPAYVIYGSLKLLKTAWFVGIIFYSLFAVDTLIGMFNRGIISYLPYLTMTKQIISILSLGLTIIPWIIIPVYLYYKKEYFTN